MANLAVATFQQSYCRHHRCNEADFSTRIFWRTLPPHAAVIAVFCGGFRGRIFSLDRDFLSSVARATTVDQVREEIRDYMLDSQNRRWLRRRLRVRISCRRLKSIAREYLPDGIAPDSGSMPSSVTPVVPG
ncbi:MAG TPA: hypothetical protein VHE61_05975 [Opitutaceae bacterium]|nr:hypothetical protein [Opitutaceae bacterium]